MNWKKPKTNKVLISVVWCVLICFVFIGGADLLPPVLCVCGEQEPKPQIHESRCLSVSTYQIDSCVS